MSTQNQDQDRRRNRSQEPIAGRPPLPPAVHDLDDLESRQDRIRSPAGTLLRSNTIASADAGPSTNSPNPPFASPSNSHRPKSLQPQRIDTHLSAQSQPQRKPSVLTNNTTENTKGKHDLKFYMKVLRRFLGWLTPYEQLVVLRKERENKKWERFRDSLMKRWSSLNVICGLILGAVSAIEFSSMPLTSASFTLGIISLLSSLIAIGFGVGLIYVLGDVRGSSLSRVDNNYPRLHLFALSIPEIWAYISFGAFFADICAISWQASDKGWTVKAGVVAATVALVVHLVAFGYLFREGTGVIPTEELGNEDEEETASAAEKEEGEQLEGQERVRSQSPQPFNVRDTEGRGRDLDVAQRVFSSQRTLVESPTRGRSFLGDRRPSEIDTKSLGKGGQNWSRGGSGMGMDRKGKYVPVRASTVESLPEEADGGVRATPGTAFASPRMGV